MEYNSPMKNMAYWKAKNGNGISPAKQSVNVEETKEERDARREREIEKKVEIDKKNAKINLAKIQQDEKDEKESPGSTGNPNPIPEGGYSGNNPGGKFNPKS
jgi:hypothetical protein